MIENSKDDSRGLQEAVLKFFELNPQEARVDRIPKQGIALVTLRGSLAQVFRNQTIPHPDQSDARLLRLLLDSKYAAVARGYQTVAPRSSIVNIIENRLQSEPIRMCRSVALINVSRSFDDLISLGIVVRHLRPTARCSYELRRYFVATYLFRQMAYECQEDYIPIVTSEATGSVLAPALVGHFASLRCVDCQEVKNDAVRNIILPAPALGTVQQMLVLSEAKALERAQAVASQTHQAKALEYQAELQREKLAFEADLRLAGAKLRKLQLQQNYEDKVRKLGELYEVKTELTLTSLQEVQVPLVNYHLQLESDSQLFDLGRSFEYDALGDLVRTQICDRCGGSDEHKEWNFCRRGLHLECGSCNTVRCCSANNCQNTACETHGVQCKGAKKKSASSMKCVAITVKKVSPTVVAVSCTASKNAISVPSAVTPAKFVS